MAGRCQIDVIESIEALDPLEANWTAVYAADPEAQFFLSWTWMHNWLSALRAPWLVLAARPDGHERYAAFLPLQIRTDMRTDGGFINSLIMAGHNLAAYTGFLCDPDHETVTVPAFAEAVAGLNWARIHLDTSPNSADRLKLFTDRFKGSLFEVRKFGRRDPGDDVNYSIYPYLELPTDFEAFLSTNLRSKTRYNARNALRQLDDGDLRITDADVETIDAHLDTLLSLWEAQWEPVKGEALTRYDVRNYRAMLRACFEADAAVVSVLWHGEKPLGADGVLLDRKTNTMLGLISSRDVEVKGPSPNFLLRLHLARWGIEHGFATYDLLQGNHAHKYKFGPKERVLDSQVVMTSNGLNRGGRLEPRAVATAFTQVQLAQRANEPDKVVAGCKQILEVAPDHAGALELRGTVTLQRRQFRAAARDLSRAVALAPDGELAQYHYGVALLNTGQAEQALECFDRAIALNPDFAAPRTGRDAALKQLGGRTGYGEATATTRGDGPVKE